jgi:hypothetical protein
VRCEASGICPDNLKQAGINLSSMEKFDG